jgi:type IV pilus assembly protein PilY1
VTDGMPTGEPETLVVDVAGSLQSTDHSASLANMQNVIVHTVGFDVPDGAALLADAAEAGGGNSYTTSTAAQLEAAILDALGSILQDAYTFSAPLIPSTGVDGGTHAYLASFQPQPSQPFWNGHLKAYERGSDGLVPVDADGHPLESAVSWDAGAVLAAKAASTRTIYTAVSGARQAFTTANGAITQALLGVSSSSMRTRVINFIRGTDSSDVDADGNTTEEREWKLGDIFHSAPVLVFPPPLTSPDADYATFKETHASRPTVVLAGANDGMLHAFRASDGEELWGWIPTDLLDELQQLVPRVGTHPYFVDGSPVVADVKLSGTWKTIALFGERRGGRYYYALDISDTTNPQYLWSYTSARMGETWSVPVIGKVRLTGGVEKYVAFVGGGYNTASNNTTGKTFAVIDLETGQALWEYYNTGSADKAYMNFSIAASPTAVDLDDDGFIDRVYIGDVGGLLWKFDVSAVGTLSSGVVTNWTGKRLFISNSAQANPPPAGAYYPSQAIYGAPAIARDEFDALWVYFGTGDRNHPNNASANRFYGIKDDTTMANGAALTEASLVDVTSSAPDVTQGWYLQLAANEKVLDSAEVFGGIVYFTTYTPTSAEPCEADLGLAQLYAVQMENGHAALDWSTDEELTETDGTEDRSEDVGTGIPSAPGVSLADGGATLVLATTSQEITDLPLPIDSEARIRYWREVY